MSSDRKWDIVLFGATGFTGERIAQYLARTIHGVPGEWVADAAGTAAAAAASNADTAVAADQKGSVADAKSSAQKRKFAIAGRSKQRLTELRTRVHAALKSDAAAHGTNAGVDALKAEDVCGIVDSVDVADEGALQSMCRNARVLINATGPYRYYGERVIKACIATATHYIDISGETEFMERMYVAHDDAAKKAGITVVSACGFDSLTADLGVIFTQQSFATVYPKGVLSKVESVLTVTGGKKGITGHATTLEALLESLANVNELRKARKELKKKQTEKFGEVARFGAPSKKDTMLPTFDKRVGRYTLPFMGSDVSVVRNSQYQCYAIDKENGVSNPRYPYYSAYFSIASAFWAAVVILIGIVLQIASKFKFARKLLVKYPHLFTFGAFTHDGPTEQQLKETRLKMDFFGSGYASEADATGKPDVNVHTIISGPEPGYFTCSIVCGQSALVLLDEIDSKQSPIPFGVMTPAPAFRGTDLIERVHAEGVKFSVNHVTKPASA